MNSRRNYNICSQCIMDTSDPEIVFDHKGICNHCRAYETRARNELFDPEISRGKLDTLVQDMRRTSGSRKYDCVIGVSGGVDSTMVAYTVRKLGLRPLAVHFDNGWNTELSVYNIENTLKILDIDLETFVMDWEEFRDLQLSFFKASVANVEVLTDHAIMALLFKIAAKNSIQYVISGGNIVTEAIMPKSWMYDPRDLRHIAAIQKQFGTRPLKNLPRCSLAEYFYYIFMKKIKYVPILNYTNYNKEEAKKTIMKELSWRDYGGKHYESIFTRFFQAYYLPEKFGFDKRRPHLSTLIVSGQMKRDDAIDEMKRPAYSPDLFQSDLDFFLKKMNLSRQQWEQIMRLPVQTYRDYPSNSFVFDSEWIIKAVKTIIKPKSLD